MKRNIIAIVATALMGMTAFSAVAQTNVSLDYGVKAGLNLSSMILSDDFNVLETEVKPGADFGGFMRINLHENFAIQPELEFYYRGTGIKAEAGPVSLENKINQWGMQIPVYALGKVELGKGQFYGGPYFGVGFSAKTDDIEFGIFKKDPIDLYEEYNDKSALQRWDVGIACQLGYEFANGIQINAGYKYGFINQVDDLKSTVNDVASKFGTSLKDDSYKANASVFTIGMGYRF